MNKLLPLVTPGYVSTTLTLIDLEKERSWCLLAPPEPTCEIFLSAPSGFPSQIIQVRSRHVILMVSKSIKQIRQSYNYNVKIQSTEYTCLYSISSYLVFLLFRAASLGSQLYLTLYIYIYIFI